MEQVFKKLLLIMILLSVCSCVKTNNSFLGFELGGTKEDCIKHSSELIKEGKIEKLQPLFFSHPELFVSHDPSYKIATVDSEEYRDSIDCYYFKTESGKMVLGHLSYHYSYGILCSLGISFIRYQEPRVEEGFTRYFNLGSAGSVKCDFSNSDLEEIRQTYIRKYGNPMVQKEHNTSNGPIQNIFRDGNTKITITFENLETKIPASPLNARYGGIAQMTILYELSGCDENAKKMNKKESRLEDDI